MGKVINFFTGAELLEPKTDDFEVVQENLVQMAKEIGQYVGIMKDKDTVEIRKIMREMDAKSLSIASQKQHLQQITEKIKREIKKETRALEELTNTYSKIMYTILDDMGVNTDAPDFGSNVVITGKDGHLWLVSGKAYEEYLKHGSKVNK